MSLISNIAKPSYPMCLLVKLAHMHNVDQLLLECTELLTSFLGPYIISIINSMAASAIRH